MLSELEEWYRYVYYKWKRRYICCLGLEIIWVTLFVFFFFSYGDDADWMIYCLGLEESRERTRLYLDDANWLVIALTANYAWWFALVWSGTLTHEYDTFKSIALMKLTWFLHVVYFCRISTALHRSLQRRGIGDYILIASLEKIDMLYGWLTDRALKILHYTMFSGSVRRNFHILKCF